MHAGGEIAVERPLQPVVDDPDRLLVEAALAGDPDAFETLVDRHWRKVASVAGRFLRDPNDVDDAIQETFVKAFTHLRTFRGEASVRNWLIRILINVCRNRQRSFWRRSVFLTAGSVDLPFEGADARALAEQDLRNRELYAAVNRLPEKLRLPLVLHFFEELTGAEIAGVLGCKESTVWSRIYAARRELRRRLGAFADE